MSWSDLPARLAELAASCGKQARLVIEGEDTRLDPKRSQIIQGAITHLLTNAIDHGIETPQQRQELGKPAEATVRLRVSRQGDHICIELQDDGRGVDVVRVRQKALQLGLASEPELAGMSEPEIARLDLRAETINELARDIYLRPWSWIGCCACRC